MTELQRLHFLQPIIGDTGEKITLTLLQRYHFLSLLAVSMKFYWFC